MSWLPDSTPCGVVTGPAVLKGARVVAGAPVVAAQRICKIKMQSGRLRPDA